MNRTDAPGKQSKPFGVNGQREPLLPTTPAGDNTASYDMGFPPITMILKSAGGLPPKGQDMNQILFELSSLCRWFSAGALNTYDSTFSTDISGYPAGAALISDDGNDIYINTTDANTTNPNASGAGWKKLFDYLGLGTAAKLTAPSLTIVSSTSFRINIPVLLSGIQTSLILQAYRTTSNSNVTMTTVSHPVAFPVAALAFWSIDITDAAAYNLTSTASPYLQAARTCYNNLTATSVDVGGDKDIFVFVLGY
jgi:hypothetical protein